MASVNVEKLSLKELLDLEDRINRAILAARERERADVRQKIEMLAKDAGFSLGEIFGGRGGFAKGKAVAAKYVNPENKSETWTGRGRKPRWLTAKLDKGARLEDFAVR